MSAINVVLFLACIYGMWNMSDNMYSINKYNLPSSAMEEVFKQADMEDIDEAFFNVLKLEQMTEILNLVYTDENVLRIRNDVLLKKKITEEQMKQMSSGPTNVIQFTIIIFTVVAILKYMAAKF
jgi:hypothetical protein